jgi:hypothetical protein
MTSKKGDQMTDIQKHIEAVRTALITTYVDCRIALSKLDAIESYIKKVEEREAKR